MTQVETNGQTRRNDLNVKKHQSDRSQVRRKLGAWPYLEKPGNKRNERHQWSGTKHLTHNVERCYNGSMWTEEMIWWWVDFL